jgi:hypothetical protein
MGSGRRFRVALSFAGESREFVSAVADILAARFGKDTILYDRYHQAEFARPRLASYLPNLYEKESDLIVAVLCPGYEGKEWCGLEWDVILGLLKKRRTAELMLTRFERVEVEDLRGLAGFIDLDDITPDQTADLILERLAVNEGLPRDQYKTTAFTEARILRSPIQNNLPRLQSFFGRERELAAIREALDPESRTWGALIDGPGGMGKTSLAVRAAYDCPPGQFQRIVFVSLKNRELDDDGVRELSGFLLSGLIELLNELARELDRPGIVLDNLESLTRGDRDQLFTFIKRLPQGCKAILTSRRRIGSGSDLVILERLDQAAALATLADLASHNPLLARTTEAERIALYEQTGGNPSCCAGPPDSSGAAAAVPSPTRSASSETVRRTMTRWSSSSVTSRASSIPMRRPSWPRSATSRCRRRSPTSPRWSASASSQSRPLCARWRTARSWYPIRKRPSSPWCRWSAISFGTSGPSPSRKSPAAWSNTPVR